MQDHNLRKGPEERFLVRNRIIPREKKKARKRRESQIDRSSLYMSASLSLRERERESRISSQSSVRDGLSIHERLPLPERERDREILSILCVARLQALARKVLKQKKKRPGQQKYRFCLRGPYTSTSKCMKIIGFTKQNLYFS